MFGRAAFAAVSVFEFFLLGTMPIGDWAPVGLMIPVSATGVLVMLVLFASVAASRPSLMADRTIPRYRDSDSSLEDLREAV